MFSRNFMYIIINYEIHNKTYIIHNYIQLHIGDVLYKNYKR